jgi:hypothetical protein
MQVRYQLRYSPVVLTYNAADRTVRQPLWSETWENSIARFAVGLEKRIFHRKYYGRDAPTG